MGINTLQSTERPLPRGDGPQNVEGASEGKAGLSRRNGCICRHGRHLRGQKTNSDNRQVRNSKVTKLCYWLTETQTQ